MCEHLSSLEIALKFSQVKETYRGQPWSKNCREWVYFDCILNSDTIRQKFQLPDFIVYHTNDDPRSGTEAGFVCEKCQDAIIGHHPTFTSGKLVFT
jgi:hypothetical protein